MTKALSIFLPTFMIVLIINQSAYGSCYESYCLSAALPKVIMLSSAISAFVYWVIKSEKK